MKTWQRYSQHLSAGEWHVHTDYTDGHGSVDDYCRRAVEVGVPLIAFTEHVRRTLDYDINAFLDDIDRARGKYDLVVLSGCEAKVLPDGTLDVDDAILGQVDYPIFAFHSFPYGPDPCLRAILKVMDDPRINAWAHPVTFIERSGLASSEEAMDLILRKMGEMNVLFESNGRYGEPPGVWTEAARRHGVSFVRASDLHRVDDLR